MPKPQESDLKQEMASQLIDMCVGVRQRRRLIEENWLRSRRAWMNLGLDARFHPTDSSPAPYNVPAGRRAAERTVVRIVKLLTPNVKWYEMSPVGAAAEQNASNVDKFMNYILRKRIKSRSNIGQLARSMVMYGLCHLKTSITVQNGRVWPSQRVVDPFSYYTFPETAVTDDEGDIQFEDYMFSFDKYSNFARLGIVEEIDRSDLVKPEWPYHLVERLAYQGISDPTQDIDTSLADVRKGLERLGSSFVAASEMWLPKNDKLFQVYIVWNHKEGPLVTGFIRSEYDSPLYRSVIHRPLPGERYTNSQMDDIVDLNNMQNDDIAKFKDAVDWEQGIVAFNTQAGARRDSLQMKGRAKWEFNDDPKVAMSFINPPDTSSNILRAWQIELGLINSLAGVGTIGEGQPGRNMPRAGNAVNGLINLAMADIQDIAELLEQEVLTPSLSDIYKVSSQFIPDHQLIRIPGGEALYNGQKSSLLKRENIIGDYEFEWIGSLQFQDDQQRAQRLMIFLNLMPTLAPILQAQGYIFNAVALIKMIWRYGLGERGLSEVVIPIGQQLPEGQQPAPGTQQLSPGGLPGTANGVPPLGSNGSQPGGGSNGTSNGVANGVAGLKYSLPQPASGFLRG